MGGGGEPRSGGLQLSSAFFKVKWPTRRPHCTQTVQNIAKSMAYIINQSCGDFQQGGSYQIIYDTMLSLQNVAIVKIPSCLRVRAFLIIAYHHQCFCSHGKDFRLATVVLGEPLVTYVTCFAKTHHLCTPWQRTVFTING